VSTSSIVKLTVSTDAVSCYSASIVNFICLVRW